MDDPVVTAAGAAAGRQKNDGPSQPPCALGPPEGVFDCALLSPKIALSPSLLLCERTSSLHTLSFGGIAAQNLVPLHYPHDLVRPGGKILQFEFVLAGLLIFLHVHGAGCDESAVALPFCVNHDFDHSEGII